MLLVHLIWTYSAYFFTSVDCLNSYPQSCLTTPVVAVSQIFMFEKVKKRRGK